MRKIARSCSVCAVCTILLVCSCARIDQLSDNNTVSEFRILSHTPQEMVLGNARIDGDRIDIPIIDGKNNFPLHFRGEPVFSAPIDRITGIDFARELTLESQDDRLVFYVMAPSGLTRQYVIRAQEVSRDQENYIYTSFKINETDPPGTIVSTQGAYTLLGDTLVVFTVDGAYPLTITPEFSISEQSRFDGYVRSGETEIREFANGSTPLTFDGVGSACRIRVASASEDLRVWSVVVRHAPIVSGSDGTTTPDRRAPTDIDPRGITVSLPETNTVQVDEVFVDNLAEQIRFVVRADPDETEFPLRARLQFSVVEGVQWLGVQDDGVLTFAGWDDVKEFYLLDPQTLTSRLWRIAPEPWRDRGCDVLSFSFDYDANAAVLDRSRVDIYPENGDIYLRMTDRTASDWTLALTNVALTLSPGASAEPPALTWRGDGDWTLPIAFAVTAEDGSEKLWSVRILDLLDHAASGDCDLTAFSILRHTPNFALFDPVSAVSIDPAQRTVTLKLADDYEAYPLHVWPEYAISPFARVTSHGGGADPLVFATDGSTQTVTVAAEDGTTKDWTVVLDPPPREQGTDVVDFEVTSLPSGTLLGAVATDDPAGVIRVKLNAAVGFPFRVGYAMTLSKKAGASIPLRGTHVFDAYTDIREFTVTAENKSTRTWQVRLVYEPQLDNWNLNAWSSATTPSSWATANNTFVKGTNRIDRGSGNYAAELTTAKAPIVGTLASGSLFLGWFDAKNALGGLSDPNKLTFFGQSWAASGAPVGMEIDVSYAAGATFTDSGDRETASCAIELVKHNPASGAYVYHGTTPQGVPHSANTAVAVARGEALLANASGKSWKGTDLVVVPAGEWTTIRVRIDFPDGTTPDFTHLSIVFSSSAQGNRFVGVSGSTLRVDNIRLLYE